MPKSQEIQVKITGRVDSSYNKSVTAASQKMNELTKGSKNISGSFADAEKSSRSFGSGSSEAVSNLDAALASAGIMAILNETAQAFMECVEAAEQYETALAKISTIADPAQVSMETIKNDITTLSQDTGQSVNDLSESVYQAISASVETADAVDFVRQSNMLAVGGFTDTTTAVDVLTTALNAYGLETSRATNISDMLITTQKLGKTTVGELGQTLGTVIPTAAAYKVNMENVSAAMVTMTKQGINTATAGTSLRAMLSELAKDGSDVSNVLREETGKSFSALMSEGKSLGDILNILGQSVDGDSTAFANLFSNVRAKQGALAIFNSGAKEFNGTVSQMANSVGATADAYGKMENTAEHAQKVFTNSVDNLEIAIGEQLSPAISDLYEMGSEILQGVTAFVKEHPEVVAAVTGVAVAVGVFAAALVGYTIAVKAAEIATNMFTAAMDANPVFAILSAAVALTAGIVALVAAMNDASRNGKELTETSKQQKDELDRLNQKYDEAVEKYGKTSTEALELKEKIGKLTEEFENSQQTYGELLSDQAQISDSFAKLLEQDKSDELEEEAANAGYLVNKLFALAEQTTVTTAAQEEMKAIIAKLNSEYEGLNLTYDDVISKTANTKEALKGYLEALYNKEQYQNAQSQWTETYALLQKQEEQFDKLKREAVAASDKYMAAVEENDGFATVWDYQEYQDFWNRQIEYTNAAGETVKGTFREAFEEAKGNIESMKGKLDEYESKMLEVSGATDEASESQKKWEEAASEAIQGVQGDLDNLAAAYDEAFESAQKSIQNTVSLTSELSNETEITTGKLTETWESQIEWIKKYSENLQKAQKYGITDGLITSLSDGSEESGKYINQIISELDGLNEKDAKELVKKLNDDFNGVKSAEGEFAKTVADYKTDFSNTMDSLQKKAESTINAMNLSDEAKKSAKETVQAYVSEINSQIAGASFGNATGAVKSAVLSALTPNGVYAYAQASPFVEANAKGTKHSADVFLAGEEGPELIVNAEGSQVFTAAETQRILNGDADEESGDRYSFDLPELIRQLAEDDDASRPTLAERADALDSGDSNSYSSSSVNHISYSPTYQINGSSNESIMEGVRKADKMSKSEFAKMMREYELEFKRTSFK